MKKIVIILTAILALLLFPGTGYAVNAVDPGPDFNIKIEYRYAEGEEGSLNVPAQITRFGRGYHLIDKQAPVKDSLLPATRVYTYHIDGYLTEEQKKEYENVAGIKLTPVEVPVYKMVDKTEVIKDLPYNDVDILPNTKSYQIAKANGLTEEALMCAAVSFKVQDYDEWDLPKSYTATIVYRGLQVVMEPGYYRVDSTYNTTEELDGVPVFVVVATYAPDTAPAVYAGTGSGSGGAGTGGGEEITPITPPVDAGDGGGDSVLIPNENVPESAGSSYTPAVMPVRTPANAVSWIPLLIAVTLGAICVLLLYLENKRKKERAARREERKRSALRARGLMEFD